MYLLFLNKSDFLGCFIFKVNNTYSLGLLWSLKDIMLVWLSHAPRNTILNLLNIVTLRRQIVQKYLLSNYLVFPLKNFSGVCARLRTHHSQMLTTHSEDPGVTSEGQAAMTPAAFNIRTQFTPWGLKLLRSWRNGRNVIRIHQCHLGPSGPWLNVLVNKVFNIISKTIFLLYPCEEVEFAIYR